MNKLYISFIATFLFSWSVSYFFTTLVFPNAQEGEAFFVAYFFGRIMFSIRDSYLKKVDS